MGKIITYLCETCEIKGDTFHLFTQTQVKGNHIYSTVDADKEWTIQVGNGLLKARNLKTNKIEIPGFTSEEVGLMLYYVCTF